MKEMKGMKLKVIGIVTLVPILCMIMGGTKTEQEKAAVKENKEIWYVTPSPAPEEEKEIKPEITKPEELSVVFNQFRVIKGCPWSIGTQKKVYNLCLKRDLKFELIMAMAYTESRFAGQAIGDAGIAYGAWQIHPDAWKEEIKRFGYGKEDMKDIVKQAHVLTYLMEAHMKRFNGNTKAAVMAWNGGGDYAERMIKANKTSEYAREILTRAGRWMKR